MERTTMVRAHDTEHDVHTDEPTLSRHGWPVEWISNPASTPRPLARVRTRFTRTATPAHLVVTYARQRPT